MNLVYHINDKPKFPQLLLFALQQLLAILAATILVPAIVNGNSEIAKMSQSAALFGAGAGTLIYQLFTKFKSPVFLGSSFAFITPMCVAFSGALAASTGYLGLLLGAVMAGAVYVIIALLVKFFGTSWISKLMPPVVIGPTVAIIGMSLSVNAINSVVSGATPTPDGTAFEMNTTSWLSLICGLVTMIIIFICSSYGKKMMKLIPFIVGILGGYIVALVFTLIGTVADVEKMKIIDFSPFKSMSWLPDFAFVRLFGEPLNFGDGNFWSYLGKVAVAYVPVAFVVFAEHIADHKNLSSIIGKDLLEEPGLHRTLLGDGVGSMVGALFGGCPNTTYGESVGCVAITKNASVITITTTAIIAMASAFFAPFVAFLSTIPACVVMGGACIALYGFIAVSGLKMIQKVNLEESSNLFTVSVILICGIGGLALKVGEVTLTSIACSLILGIITNVLLNLKKKNAESVPADEEVAEEPIEENKS